ncbi:hypothetical protein F5Y10DRAFT_272285 [Nemania abortiva]|nr:hypothetical protein F5Y10DRAFT_272285 [Nemania abortiva]
MADPQPPTEGSMGHESRHLNPVVTYDEPGESTRDGGDPERCNKDLAVANMRLMKEMRALRQRTAQVKRAVQLKSARETPEAEWEHKREELGQEQEKELWEKEKQQLKAEFVAATLQPNSECNVDDTEKVPREPGASETSRESRDVVPLRIPDDITVAKNFGGIPSPQTRSEINRVPWAQFKALRELDEGLNSAAIDVLVGEPVIESSFEPFGPPHGRETETVQDQELRVAPREAPMPERIRINSRNLVRLLLDISNSDISEFHGKPLVLLRPFRALLYYKETIRQISKELEAEPEQAERPIDQDATNIIVDTGKEIDERAGGVSNIESQLGKKSRTSQMNRNKYWYYVTSDQELSVLLEHIKLLMEFLDNDVQRRINYLESGRCQEVVFSDIWYLFQPGGLIIENGGKQAYRILSTHSVGHRAIDPWNELNEKSLREGDEEEESITIECVYVDFDGKQLGPVSKVFLIPKFEGEVVVTTFRVYPLRFHPFQNEAVSDGPKSLGGELKKYLMNRGKKFLKVAAIRLADIKPMYYAGAALRTRDKIESQVIIDFEAALEVEEHIIEGWEPKLETLVIFEENEIKSKRRRCEADCCTREDVYDDSYVETKRNNKFMRHLLPSTREELPSVTVVPRRVDAKAPEAGLTEDDLVILSYRVFGFVMKNRKWAQLDLTYLRETQPSRMKREGDDKPGEISEGRQPTFDELVLPDGHKNTILSIITQHFCDQESSHTDQTDMVRGEGKGLVILLHGALGVGKTATAVGVAERFNKPLLQLTCSDLGVTVKDIESSLRTNFKMANRWGCMLLLDEADMFLVQRTKEDIRRTGPAAVFLRLLKYYPGVLFLTTNRVSDLDQAVASHIHASLYYPKLGLRETFKVFNLNIRLLKERFRGRPYDFIPEVMKIGAFAQTYWKENPSDRWNGRQIGNVCTLALSLAEFEAREKSHVTSLNSNTRIHLNASHFEAVVKGYLAFSQYLKDNIGTTLSSDQALPYRGGHGDLQDGSGQVYYSHSRSARPHQTRPQAYYSGPLMAQHYNDPNQQWQRQTMAPGPQQLQDWDSHDAGYGCDPRYLDTGERMSYARQQLHCDARHLNPQGRGPPQERQSCQPSSSGRVPRYAEPGPEDDFGEDQDGTY